MKHPKRICIVLAVVLFLSIPAITSNQEMEITLTIPSYTISRVGDYDVITMEGFFNRGPPGYPALPQKIIDVEVPRDADLDSVKMTLSGEQTEDLMGSYLIGPAPLPAPGYDYTPFKGGKDTSIYGTDAWYPQTYVEILRTFQTRDGKFVRLQYTPFQYNPVTFGLRLTWTSKVILSWTSQPFRTLGAKAGGPGYVIVTTNTIVANSTRLKAFVNFLQLQGFTVHTITENHYGAATGQQRAINIRNWLQANYIINNIRYVLLVGDPDPDDPTTGDTFGTIPMMMCWPNPGSTADQTPTDYFYADLTGNWDSDGDTHFGEFGQDLVDFGPEVYVGRVPVYGSDYTSLDSIFTKFMAFRGANPSIMLPMAISNYQDEETSANGCVAGWLRTDGLNLPQQVLTTIATPLGMTSFVMYETAGVTGRGHDPVPTSAFGYTAPITNANVITQWGKDYGMVFWWGHGSQTAASRKYWSSDANANFIVEDGSCAAVDELAWPAFFSTPDTLSLTSTRTFTFQCSCLNGYPENPGNVQYSLLKNGAISTVGSTRICWYGQGTWNFAGFIDNASIGYVYVGNLLFGQPAGDALYNGKNSLINPWGWIGWQNLFDFNLYGDPSMYFEGPLVIPPTPPPGGDPRPPHTVNFTTLLCPLAKYRVEKVRDLLEEVRELLQKVKDTGKDVSAIEELIDEAEELIKTADKYCLMNNCIPGNYFVMRATQLLEEAMEQLKALC